jgi:hypothetical protein
MHFFHSYSCHVITNYSKRHEEDWMHKLLVASFLVIILMVLNTSAFASTLNCKFKSEIVSGVESIVLNEDFLVINEEMEIPLDKTKVNCGNFKQQTRFDGSAMGYQVVLKSCTTEAVLEGHLIDSVKQEIADVICD